MGSIQDAPQGVLWEGEGMRVKEGERRGRQ